MKTNNFLKNVWFWIIINKVSLIILTTILVVMFFCVESRRKHYPELVYTNIDLRIVAINSDCSLTDDKFHKPQLCNTVLFETITEPHLYCEINTCDLPKRNGRSTIHINTAWLYNHQKGDTVHFDYLHKDRFFEIKPR